MSRELYQQIRTAFAPMYTCTRPDEEDVEDIFRGYASDEVAMRYLTWAINRRMEQTEHFLLLSDHRWETAGCGPMLLRDQQHQLLACFDMKIEAPERASIGYIIVPEVQRRGFGRLVVKTLCRVAFDMGCVRVQALTHVDNGPSAALLDACGFQREAHLQNWTRFPNLEGAPLGDILVYARFAEHIRTGR